MGDQFVHLHCHSEFSMLDGAAKISPMLAEAQILWPGFSASWPTAGPGASAAITPVPAWGLPAINTLLQAIGEAPIQVYLEAGHDDDRDLQVGTGAPGLTVTWVDRKNNGEALVETVRASAFDASDHFGWVACDNRTTRSVVKVLRECGVTVEATERGMRVAALNGINGTNGTWTGISVSRFFTPKSIADVILKVGRPMLDWPPADGKKAL